MHHVRKLTILLSIVIGLFLPFSIFSQDPRHETPKDSVSGSKSIREKNSTGLNLKLDVKVYGGGLFNYESYNINTALLGAMVGVTLNVDFTDSLYLQILSKSEGRKTFTALPGTKLTLDQFRQYARGRFGIEGNLGEIYIDMNYYLTLRPSWPDLYQPNPLAFNGTPDPRYDSYLPTDRNSSQRISPDISVVFTKVKNLEISLNPGYVRNIETLDPAFDPNVPTHITPSTYSGFFIIAEAKYKAIKNIDLEFTNRFETLDYDTALARDALTGKTHYMTTPNPKYKEVNNKSTLAAGIEFDKIDLEIKPFFSLDFSTDPYQGYYSYTGFEPGIEIKQKFGRFHYVLKFSKDFQNYGPNSFDATKTIDGKALFKNYLKGALELNYHLNKNFELFAEAELLIKNTNYPSYVPGVNPASKNYDINFSFNNYSVYSGVNYKFK